MVPKQRGKPMEIKLYSPTVWSYNHLDQNGHALPGHGHVCREIPYSIYQETVKNRKVGDVIRSYAGAPGIGYVEHRITKIDETGVYAVEIENTVKELTADDVM